MKTHNRMSSLVVSLLAVSILLVGCSESQAAHSGECLLIDKSNTDTGPISVPIERTYWDGQYFTDADADAVATITFDGVEYTGEYWQSIYEKFNSFATHIYICEPGGVEFGLNADTNALVFVDLKTLDFFETEPRLSELQSPETETAEIAREYAMSFIDPDAYTLLSSDPKVRTYLDEETGVEYEMSFYTYDFVKYVNGIGTSDFLAIQVTSKGNLASIHSGAIGSFTDSALTTVSEDSYDDVITNKIASILSVYGVETIQYEIVREYLAITPNDEPVLVVYTSAEIKDSVYGIDDCSVGLVLAVMLE